MHETQLLHTFLRQSCPKVHSTRLSSLMDGVSSLLAGNKLSVAGLGRSHASATATRYQIKKMDYLVGNAQLYNERLTIYSALVSQLLLPNSKPDILVDWSRVSVCGNFHMLSASLCAQGRAIMIYNEVYEEKNHGSKKAHRTFLDNLARVLGPTCCPTIITDAGFRNPWFQAVKSMGWEFIGRVRNRTLMREHGKAAWQPCKSVYYKASFQPKYIGEYTVAKQNPLIHHLHITKKRKKDRIHKNLKGEKVRASLSRNHAKRANEPWLIATSLCPKKFNAKRIMKRYAKRMQIEETFRDLKNHHNGFSFSSSRSRSCTRFEILLLIAVLATFILWLVGLAAIQQGHERQFQANSVRSRKVISTIFLAKEVMRKKMLKIPKLQIRAIFNNIALIVQEIAV